MIYCLWQSIYVYQALQCALVLWGNSTAIVCDRPCFNWLCLIDSIGSPVQYAYSCPSNFALLSMRQWYATGPIHCDSPGKHVPYISLPVNFIYVWLLGELYGLDNITACWGSGPCQMTYHIALQLRPRWHDMYNKCDFYILQLTIHIVLS